MAPSHQDWRALLGDLSIQRDRLQVWTQKFEAAPQVLCFAPTDAPAVAWQLVVPLGRAVGVH